MTEKQLYNRVKTVTAGAVILFLVLLLYILIQSITLSNLNNSKAKLEESLGALDAQTQGIQDEIDYRNSRTYIEQYAREVLGYCYGDEYKYKYEE